MRVGWRPWRRGRGGRSRPFRGKLDLFHEANLTFRRSTRSELHTLGEVELRETFPALRADWHRLSQAAYGVALIELTTEPDTPMPETWGVFRRFLGEICRGARSPLPVLALELQQLEQLGQLPDLERESLPAASRELAEDLVAWEGEEPLAAGGGERGGVASAGAVLAGVLDLPLGAGAAGGGGEALGGNPALPGD
jgi:hypothetical protein